MGVGVRFSPVVLHRGACSKIPFWEPTEGRRCAAKSSASAAISVIKTEGAACFSFNKFHHTVQSEKYGIFPQRLKRYCSEL